MEILEEPLFWPVRRKKNYGENVERITPVFEMSSWEEKKRIGRFRDKNRAHIDRIYEVKCQESTKCPDHPTINLYRFEMYVRMHYKNIPLYINLYLIFNNMFDDNVDDEARKRTMKAAAAALILLDMLLFV